MKKIYFILGAIILGLFGIITLVKNSSISPVSDNLSEKIYVAAEKEGTIHVINPRNYTSIGVIDLTEIETGTKYLPHNVQASPDGKSVWVTANAGMEKHSLRFITTVYADEGHEEMNMDMGDQVIVIDPINDVIIKRIPLGNGQHLSHVVFTPDGKSAIVASQEKDKLYQIATGSFLLEKEIILPTGSGPHGMRLSPDGTTAYVALMQGKGLGIVNLATGTVEIKPLSGAAVQTAVTPDGNYVATSVYDTRSIALYDTALETSLSVDLPDGSQGPVQLYPTVDSRFVYIADQGVLQGRPANNKVYVLDLATKTIIDSITVGNAPHGIVVSEDNRAVYVTNLQSDTVSVIDTETGKEITQIPVGSGPNGITIWKRNTSLTESKITLAGKEVTVYKSESCSCCHVYMQYLERYGVNVQVENVIDLSAVKDKYGVPEKLGSCHTSIVGDYVVEGHVPIEVIEKLLVEQTLSTAFAIASSVNSKPVVAPPDPNSRLASLRTALETGDIPSSPRLNACEDSVDVVPPINLRSKP